MQKASKNFAHRLFSAGERPLERTLGVKGLRSTKPESPYQCPVDQLRSGSVLQCSIPISLERLLVRSLAEIIQPFHPFRVAAACEVEPWTLSLLVKACKSLPALEYTFF